MIAQFKTLITFAIELTIDAILATVWICNFEILFSLKIKYWFQNWFIIKKIKILY